MGLQRFERRLERLVEGTFSRAFRSGLQPVEIGRKLCREMDALRTVGVRGPVAPNRFAIYLSDADYERFRGFEAGLVRELTEAAREHARDEGYHFIGPLEITLVVDDGFKQGDFDIGAAIEEGAGGRVGALVLADGRRVLLGDETATIGRLPDCAVQVDDPRASRHHAEIRPDADGYILVDLGSMNGTSVNGVPVREHTLRDGDEIGVGGTRIRFEAS